MQHTQPFIVAIVGEKAAGKGTAASFMRKHHGATVLRFSDPIRVVDLVERGDDAAIDHPNNLISKTTHLLRPHVDADAPDLFSESFYDNHNASPPPTERLQDIGNDWRARFGTGIFTKVLLGVAEALHRSIVVFDGMRNPGEITPLQEHCPDRHALLAIRADNDLRRHRFLEKRKRAGDPVTEEAFRAFDARDKGEGEAQHGQHVAACLAEVPSDHTIWNNGSKQEFAESIAAWATTVIPGLHERNENLYNQQTQ